MSDRYWHFRPMAYYPSQYPAEGGRSYPAGGNGGGRDPYSGYTNGGRSAGPPAPVTSQPGYYPTYPGPAGNQYDNKGYHDERRPYEQQGASQAYAQQPSHQRAPKPVLPDAHPAGMGGREWNSGLFECTKDVKTCMCVWCCGVLYMMYRGHEFGESCWNFCPCCIETTVIALRHRMRERENISGSLMKDCLASVICLPCVSCQLLRENDFVRGGGEIKPQMISRY